MRRILIHAVLCVLVAAGAVQAQDGPLRLAADERLEDSGLLAFLVPRFSLKTATRVEITPADAAALIAAATDGSADVLIIPSDAAAKLSAGGGALAVKPAFHTGDATEGGSFSVVVLTEGPGRERAAKFADWLTSKSGSRTIEQYSEKGAVAYIPGAGIVVAPSLDVTEGDATEGEKLALLHCGRCHVVNEENRFAGIGSTPSFAAMRAGKAWKEKFSAFFAANPHPSFVQVTGVTPPFDPMKPPHVAPFEISIEELDSIVAYAASIAPKDLGAEIDAR